MGFSYNQLGQELKVQINYLLTFNVSQNILFTTEEIRDRKEYGMMKPIQIQFSSTLFPQTQTLKVSRQIFNGPQYSLFWNESRKDSVWNTQWSEEYVILNERLGLEIKVAGNTTQGLVPFIEQLGFFEGGGVLNEYRVDPVLLVAILSGKCTKEVIDLCKQKQAILLQEPLQELQTCQDRLTSCQEDLLKPNANKQDLQEEIQWIQSRIGFVQTRIEKQKEETQKYISKLESIK